MFTTSRRTGRISTPIMGFRPGFIGIAPQRCSTGSTIWPSHQEMARVTKPGGHVIVTADNRTRLTNLLDPQLHPAVWPLKRRAKEVLARLGLRRSPEAAATFHDCSCIDTYLTGAA